MCVVQSVSTLHLADPGGGGGGAPARGGRTATGPLRKKISLKMTLELQVYIDLGVSRQEVVRLRREKLEQGRHWDYTKAPRKVFYTPEGLDELRKQLGLPEVKSEAAVKPVENHWLADADIPVNKSNGLILTKGRPGWWTPEEAIVRQTACSNRTSIFVEWRGRRIVCRVEDAGKFVVGQVIPVRPYGTVLAAARKPRYQGKW